MSPPTQRLNPNDTTKYSISQGSITGTPFLSKRLNYLTTYK